MANFKRGKTKKKSHDGDGFNKTKDRDACAAAKGKGVAKKKVKRILGLEITDVYSRPEGVKYCNPWLNRPIVTRSWYETERDRDAAIKAYLKNRPEYWFAKVSRTIKKISR